MITLVQGLPAGVLWGLAGFAVLGVLLVLWGERIAVRLRGQPGDEEEATPQGPLAFMIWWFWNASATLFYLFLFGFPLGFLFVVVLPTLRVTREHQVTAQDILIYAQRRDAVALIEPTIDAKLPSNSADQVKADAQKLRSLFPNERDWIRVLTWAKLMAAEKYPNRRWKLSDDEAAHIGWRHLARYPGTKENELLQLEQVIARAVPDAATRSRLLEWGRTRNLYLDTSADMLLFTRLPPLDWFAWWTVYTQYAPTEEGLAARKTFLESQLGGDRFGRDLWAALQSWGKETYEKQPELKDLLPAGERAYMVAGVDRMVGLDQAGRKIHELDRQNLIPLGKDYGVLFLLMHLFYPNDDLAYMQFGSGWGGEHSLFALGGSELSPELFVVGLYLVLWALVVQRCMRRLTLRYLARLMRVQGKPALEHLASRAFNPWVQLLSLVVVVPATWLYARFSMEGFHVLYFRSEINLVLAVLYSAIIGGALCEMIENIIAVVCVRFGLNPERMFVDNLLAAGASVGVLWLFQNSGPSIASALGLGLFTSVSLKLFGRGTSREDGSEDREEQDEEEEEPRPRRRRRRYEDD